MTADPPFVHAFVLSGEGDFRAFLGGEFDGERPLLFNGDRDLCLLSFAGEDGECCLCLLSFLPSLSLLVGGDFDLDRI